MKEVDYIRGRLDFGEEGEDKLFERIFGEDSELFASAFKKIGVEYAEFAAFIATFYLECRLRTTPSRFVDNRDINTDRYMSLMRGTPPFGSSWTAMARGRSLPIAPGRLSKQLVMISCTTFLSPRMTNS